MSDFKRITMVVPAALTGAIMGLVADVAAGLTMETVPDPIRRRKANTNPHSTPVAERRISLVILEHYTPAGKFTLAHAGEWMTRAGFSANSASPGCSDLIKLGT